MGSIELTTGSYPGGGHAGVLSSTRANGPSKSRDLKETSPKERYPVPALERVTGSIGWRSEGLNLFPLNGTASGTPRGTRTPDTLFRRQMLYSTEL